MKITFIHHSSFCIEWKDYVIIFDYFDGKQMPEMNLGGKLPEFDEDKKIFVFSSHRHRDHFELNIFGLAKLYSNINFILSKDIKFSDNYLEKNGIDLEVKDKMHYLKPDEELDLDILHIETLKSTDEGVAFLVSFEDQTIYHAGDLNWWYWEEAEYSYNQYQERLYKEQIQKLKDKDITVAFLVLDGRLGDQKYLGIDYFMENVNAKYVIPMHMWQQYLLSAKYKQYAEEKNYTNKVIDVLYENQIITIE